MRKASLKRLLLVATGLALLLAAMLPGATATLAATHDPVAFEVVDNPAPTEAQLSTYTKVTFSNQEDAVNYEWQTIKPGTIIEFEYNNGIPYHIRFCIATKGTQEKQVIIRGIPGPNGERPIIDGEDAISVYPPTNNYWGNALINIGGQSGAHWVTLEGLEIRNANHHNSFYPNKNTNEAMVGYIEGARGVFFQAGSHFTLRNCEIHNCGNGLFSYSTDTNPSTDMLVEYNYIHDNGVTTTERLELGLDKAGAMLSHNSYCATLRTTYQYNTYGPLKVDAWGYGLKDRGTSTVIRYNKIEGGRRMISLDDGQDAPNLIPTSEDYNDAYVFGNLLIENRDSDLIRLWGDDETISYGGDGPDSEDEYVYRRGTLFFYNNTVISYRKAGTSPGYEMYPGTSNGQGREERTAVFYIPTGKQSVDCRNNIFAMLTDGNEEYDPAPLNLFSGGARNSTTGTLTIQNNLIYSPTGWATSMDSNVTAVVGIEAKTSYKLGDDHINLGTNVVTDVCPIDPETYLPVEGSPAFGMLGELHSICTGDLAVTQNALGDERKVGDLTIGAFGEVKTASDETSSATPRPSPTPYTYIYSDFDTEIALYDDDGVIGEYDFIEVAVNENDLSGVLKDAGLKVDAYSAFDVALMDEDAQPNLLQNGQTVRLGFPVPADYTNPIVLQVNGNEVTELTVTLSANGKFAYVRCSGTGLFVLANSTAPVATATPSATASVTATRAPLPTPVAGSNPNSGDISQSLVLLMLAAIVAAGALLVLRSRTAR